ncbi:ABC transporter ATP-binding protein [Magnetovirga frankeli]|uniref:ABC transporter ATP-binding protein n=1 Tax=Magnetovirga frankeli TaxID=947516 RepID=UPI0012930B36|nr:ABC transporter ATP-binding protein [gamma proteobacterium SS-5]
MLQIEDLSLGYGQHCLVRGLHLRIRPGERWALLGLNGSGKTSLLHCLAGLMAPQRGQIHLQGQPLGQLRRARIARQLGLLLQQQNDSFPIGVREALLAGLHPHLGFWGWPSPAERRRAEDLLDLLELTELAERQSDSLSGGERQRLAIAQLLLQRPSLALLDEPDSQLDPCRRTCLTELLAQRFSQPGHACLMSLHDPNLAQRCCNRVLLLFGDGRWRAGRSEELLSQEHLEQVYGCRVSEYETDRGRLFLPGF